MLQIVEAISQEQLSQVNELLQEYMMWDHHTTSSLGLDVDKLIETHYSSGKFDLPGEFAFPDGRLLLALYENRVAGCGAVRKFEDGVCEIKRMYVRSEFRGKKIGRQLLERLLEEARQIGYTHARLETVTFMKEALAMYDTLGFRIIEPYFELSDELKAITRFMELKLA